MTSFHGLFLRHNHWIYGAFIILNPADMKDGKSLVCAKYGGVSLKLKDK